MNKRLLAALLAPAIPILCLATPGNTEGETAARPRLEIRSTSHDFGQIFEQAHYIHSFVVENRGDAALEIDKVTPSCGCTLASFDKIISPGQTGHIELDIDGSKVQGMFNKTATAYTNDREHSRVILTMMGHEIPYVNVEPEGTVTMHGSYGEPVEQDLVISSNEQDLDFKVVSVTSNIDDKITYVIDDGTRPGEYTLRIYKNPKLPSLSTYGSVLIGSNSSRSPVTTVPVHVMTKSAITLSPTVLNYGELEFPETEDARAPATRSVIVTKAGGNFSIKDVTVSNPHYRAAVDEVAPGQKYRVEVTFTPPLRKATRQTESGEMIIHTDDPRDPVFKVQLLARSQ